MRDIPANMYPTHTNIFRLRVLSAIYPDIACEMETTASPSPSIKPKISMLAPITDVRKIGHSGKIMSDPKSLRNDAQPNIRSVFFESLFMTFDYTKCFR